MEAALAKVKFSGLETDESGNASDEEKETRTLVTERNKKGKKSGGFQSMGKLRLSLGRCVCLCVLFLCLWCGGSHTERFPAHFFQDSAVLCSKA